MTVNVTISSNQGTWPGGSFVIGPEQISSTYTSLETIPSTFAGAQTNTTFIPANAQGCLISPPAGNLVSLTLKGVGADTGIGISPNQPTLLAFPVGESGASTVALTSSGAINGPVTLTFF